MCPDCYFTKEFLYFFFYPFMAGGGEKLHIGPNAMLLIPDLLLFLMVGIVFEKMIADYYGNILYLILLGPLFMKQIFIIGEINPGGK